MHKQICLECATKLGKKDEFYDSMSGNLFDPCQICGVNLGTFDVDVGIRRTVKKRYYYVCLSCAKKLNKEGDYSSSFFDGVYGFCAICKNDASGKNLRKIYISVKEMSDILRNKSKVLN